MSMSLELAAADVGNLAYVDTSALAKTFLLEPETDAIRAVLSEWPVVVSSALLEVEIRRIGHREGRQADANLALAPVANMAVAPIVIARAGTLSHPTLRALDAIHLATASLLGPRLGVLL